jgi:hypothetical protein
MKKMAQVLLASTTLLSIGAKGEEQPFSMLDNRKAPTDITSVEEEGELTIDEAKVEKPTENVGDSSYMSETLNPSISAPSRIDYSERAQISFPLFSSIRDTLWAGGVYSQLPGGTFSLVERGH